MATKLQALCPFKTAHTGPSSLAALTGNIQEGPILFKFYLVVTQNGLTVVDYCHRLATVQEAETPELVQEISIAGVHAS